MPPYIALVGCATVVATLLWAERRSVNYRSWGLLVPTIWLLIVASRPLGNWLGGSVESSYTFEDGSAVDRYVLTVLIVLAIGLVYRRAGRSRIALSPHLVLVALFAFLALSVSWSDYPFVSLKRWVRLFAAVPMAFVFVTEREPLTALGRVLRRVLYILIPFSLVLIKYFPQLGCLYSRWSGVLMWQGVTLTKNSLGQLCLMTILAIAWLALRRRGQSGVSTPGRLVASDGFVLCLAVYLMVGAPSGAYSATSFAVSAIVVTAIIAVYRFRPAAKRLAMALCVGAVLGWLGMLSAQSFLAEAATLLGRDETLTGRTDIWALALSDARAHPILGSGFGGYFGTSNTFTTTYGNTGHNGVLDVYVETGIVGVAMLLAFLCAAFSSIRLALVEQFDLGAIALATLLANILSNFTESLFLKSSSYAWGMLVLLSVLSASRYWSMRTDAKEAVVDGVQRPKHESRRPARLSGSRRWRVQPQQPEFGQGREKTKTAREIGTRR